MASLGFFGAGAVDVSDSSDSDAEEEPPREEAADATKADGAKDADDDGTAKKDDDDDADDDSKKPSSSGLPSFLEVMKNTEGVAPSFTREGAMLANDGKPLDARVAKVAANAHGGDRAGFAGFAGAKIPDGPLVASVDLGVTRVREIPPRVADRLYCDNGRGLTEMRLQTGARLTLPPPDDFRTEDEAPRRVIISGSIEAVNACVDEIEDMVRQDKLSMTKNVICPAHCVGTVIGAGGFSIKSIQKETGCVVKILGDFGSGGPMTDEQIRAMSSTQGGIDRYGVATDAPERVVTVKGPPKMVQKAVQMVQARIDMALRESGWVTRDSLKREREERAMFGKGAKKKAATTEYGDADEWEIPEENTAVEEVRDVDE